MGRRAKKAPVVTKKRATLAKRFKCPFCANENAVECKMDRKNAIGKLDCRLCGASYQMGIHNLHEPIDVFSEWLDDCEAAERSNGTSAGGVGGNPTGPGEGGYDEYDEPGEYEKQSKPSKEKGRVNMNSIGLESDSDEE